MIEAATDGGAVVVWAAPGWRALGQGSLPAAPSGARLCKRGARRFTAEQALAPVEALYTLARYQVAMERRLAEWWQQLSDRPDRWRGSDTCP